MPLVLERTSTIPRCRDVGFSVSKIDAFGSREDLNDPHAAAMWDS